MVAGAAFLVTAIVSWAVVGSVPVAILCAVVGLLTLGLAWSDTRQNRRLSDVPDED